MASPSDAQEPFRRATNIVTKDRQHVLGQLPDPDDRGIGSSTHFASRSHRERSATPAAFRFTRQSSSADAPSYLVDDPEGFLSSGGDRGYIAINPFAPSVVRSVTNVSYASEPSIEQQVRRPADVSTSRYILAFTLDTLPRQIYLYLLLTLPSLYFSRVARIFEEAELSMPYIKKMVKVSAEKRKDYASLNLDLGPSLVSHPFSRLKASWEHFIDSLMREWKTLNIVSVLLLSSILTTLQIDGAATDLYTRYFALLALVCSLQSLLYGCLYILRFNTMRRAHKAAAWAEEAQKTETLIWWNVWVLLAMPAIWLSWSIIFYLTCVMTFVWRTGTTADSVPSMTPLAALAPRIAVTSFFVLGLVYLWLIISEFRRYGDVMDKAWRKKVLESTETWGSMYDTGSMYQRQQLSSLRLENPSLPPLSRRSSELEIYTESPLNMISTANPELEPTALNSFSRPSKQVLSQSPFEAIKVIEWRSMAHVSWERPNFLDGRSLGPKDWSRFIEDASLAWDGYHPWFQQESESGRTQAAYHTPQDGIAHLIALWNAEFFLARRMQAVLCEEQMTEEPTSPSHVIYLMDLQPTPDRPTTTLQGASLAQRFGKIPVQLQTIRLYDPVPPYDSLRQPVQIGMSTLLGPSQRHNVHWSIYGDGIDEDGDRTIVGEGHVERTPRSYPRSAMRHAKSSVNGPAQSLDIRSTMGDVVTRDTPGSGDAGDHIVAADREISEDMPPTFPAVTHLEADVDVHQVITTDLSPIDDSEIRVEEHFAQPVISEESPSTFPTPPPPEETASVDAGISTSHNFIDRRKENLGAVSDRNPSLIRDIPREVESNGLSPPQHDHSPGFLNPGP